MRRISPVLRAVGEAIARVCERLGALLLAGIVVINFLGVFCRYGLRDPIGWTEEAMRYAIVWATFMGATAALWRGEHMVLNLFEAAAGPRLQRALFIFAMLAVAVFCAVVVVFGVQLSLRNWQQVSPTMNVRMFWPYSAVTLGAALMLLQSLLLVLLPAPQRSA